ncbi:methyl-accepting chemotaxis protein [Heliorestis acidaminivorans]|uniref:Methyl-accepting chemotaxis protein n=1 Tax=Heliorestis acidaminivorans TaxID=553427 RepID=A0A6I0F7S9_9FIRM|nr:HAMP domain-containing methyl-accepting chemotaxis protein [Heliorestis acidaminivorans]KAB2953453.1 methyl-accepting chemotaxis protein [Heliorestis acidaminivorans]
MVSKKSTSLRVKIMAPIAVVGILILMLLSSNLVFTKTYVAKIMETRQTLNQLNNSIMNVQSATQTGIITEDEQYAIETAKESLQAFALLDRLDGLEEELAWELRESYTYFYGTLVSTNSLFLENRLQEAQERLQEAEAVVQQMQSEMNQNLRLQMEKYERAVSIQSGLLILTLLATIVGFSYLGFIVLPAMIKPLRNLAEQMGDFAQGQGDLRKRMEVTSNDEIGLLAQRFNDFLDNQSKMIDSLKNIGHTIGRSSQDLSRIMDESSKAMEQVGHTVTDVAHAVDRTAESSQDIEGSTKTLLSQSLQINRFSQSATEQSRQAEQRANEGAQVLEEALASASQVSQTAQNAAHTLQALDNASTRISEVVTMIASISEQINLLALNAAIEASRAGEQGRGFAVVADEVRKLAEESAQSTAEITKLIREVTSRAQEAVQVMAESDRTVNQVVNKTEKAGQSFRGIQKDVSQLATQMVEIDDALQKQTQAVEKIQTSLAVITEGSVETAASAQEMSASVEEQIATIESIGHSAQELALSVEKLNSLVQQFKT